MKIIGVDPSLTCTGVAGNGWADTIPTGKQRGMDRVDYIYRHLLDYTRSADLVVLEGLAYNGHDTKRQLAGLNWLIRYQLWRGGIAYAVVPPSNLKTYATGVGGGRFAGKSEVTAAVRAWFPWFAGDHNAADAAVLCAMGHDRIGRPLVQVPARHRSGLVGCEWPERIPAERAARGQAAELGRELLAERFDRPNSTERRAG